MPNPNLPRDYTDTGTQQQSHELKRLNLLSIPRKYSSNVFNKFYLHDMRQCVWIHMNTDELPTFDKTVNNIWQALMSPVVAEILM